MKDCKVVLERVNINIKKTSNKIENIKLENSSDE